MILYDLMKVRQVQYGTCHVTRGEQGVDDKENQPEDVKWKRVVFHTIQEELHGSLDRKL